MKTIYFVTEGITDQIVLEGLAAYWLGNEEFIPRRIQPPSSAYAIDLESNLSEGWKGVLAWCAGLRPKGSAGRDETLKLADCLFIHVDADVATDPDFKTSAYTGTCPPARSACDWIREHLTSQLGNFLPTNVVLCVPAQNLETWILCALHPDIADKHDPIECRQMPETLLVARKPHKLTRRKDNSIKKERRNYQTSLDAIIKGWSNCIEVVENNNSLRCPEAIRFEAETKNVLGIH